MYGKWPAGRIDAVKSQFGEVQNTNSELKKAGSMFLILAVVLVVLWLGGFTLFHVSSLLIHLLLVFAVISIIMHFVSGRRAV